MNDLESRKGEPLRFKKGKYVGQLGWKDNKGPILGVQVYCIVQKRDGGLKRVRVNQTSVASRRAEPTTFLEAAIQQHPDLDIAMDKLAGLLAKCSINHSPELAEMFKERVEDAFIRQHQNGDKATWKWVNFKEGRNMSD